MRPSADVDTDSATIVERELQPADRTNRCLLLVLLLFLQKVLSILINYSISEGLSENKHHMREVREYYA